MEINSGTFRDQELPTHRETPITAPRPTMPLPSERNQKKNTLGERGSGGAASYAIVEVNYPTKTWRQEQRDGQSLMLCVWDAR